jgi:predicted Zn-dependent protease
VKPFLCASLALSLLAQTQERQSPLWKIEEQQIRNLTYPFENPIATAYASRIGAQLVAHLPATPLQFRVEVVNPKYQTEPIPIRNGHIFIPAVFFLSAQDEDEFATMLAHAIGHIVLDASTGNRPSQVSTIPVFFLLHVEPGPGEFMFQNQRKTELAADQFAIDLSTRAGLNSAALRVYVQYQRPHSDSSLRDARLAAMDVQLRSLPPAQTSPNEEFLRSQRAVRAALNKLPL